jgi:uncharacterized repeat protein (TIGR03803 family)
MKLTLSLSLPVALVAIAFTLTTSAVAQYQETTLYTFAGTPDGGFPQTGLVADGAGNFYGTTTYGGNSVCFNGSGCGTVFKLSPVVFNLAPATAGQWTETVLHAFQDTTDGENPTATLTLDSAGHVFGTSGGLDENSPGAAFRLTPASGGGWQFQVLTALSAGSAYLTTAPLLRDSTGHMYGTSYGGGSTNCDGGCGSVYELSPVAGAK